MLQMTFKTVNNIAGPNTLISTLLIFGTYPQIVTDLRPSPLQQQRANGLAKVMIELCKLKAQRGV